MPFQTDFLPFHSCAGSVFCVNMVGHLPLAPGNRNERLFFTIKFPPASAAIPVFLWEAWQNEMADCAYEHLPGLAHVDVHACWGKGGGGGEGSRRYHLEVIQFLPQSLHLGGHGVAQQIHFLPHLSHLAVQFGTPHLQILQAACQHCLVQIPNHFFALA